MKHTLAWLFVIGMLDVLVVFVGLAVWKYHDGDAVFLNLVVISVALVTYFGFLMACHAKGGDWAIERGGMRMAITASVVTVYLVLVGLVAFMTQGPNALLPITQTMLASFTSIVGVVVAFYFGASAYVQVQEKRLERERTGKADSVPRQE
ncbi:hypothetical protein [Immundisolibacter sp.]|uniref:hypothetical protein n=1 Tax=Immundisolibacter sp. TaxID=1934948 RepID=UPI000EE3C95F|nr:hypothetical protein [Gammaproteobacteria bacterium]